jgi:hypothetical protein
MFLPSKKSPLDEDTEDWLLTCWKWLLDNVSTAEQVRQSPTILPIGDFFQETDKEGHDRALHVFDAVAALSGVADWPFDLVAQEEEFNPVLAPLAVVQNVKPDPLGTFSIQTEGRLTVSYNRKLLTEPIGLIATFIHEIAHAILMGIEEEIPGGPELEECVTDVTTVLLGFGVFGAKTSRSGYLTEAEWAFCLALFLSKKGESEDKITNWLKPNPMALLKQSMRYLRQNPGRLT